ncbi:MAG: S8 family serine peptidase [Eggerthellaceae bacterium]|nr:S8 family serine peptidase [Eggerthellaceae bacterium]
MRKFKTVAASAFAAAAAASLLAFGASAAFAAETEDVELSLIEPIIEVSVGQPSDEGFFWTLAEPFVNDPFTAVSSSSIVNENQYWAYTTGLAKAWESYQCDNDVVIAVIDSGATTVHEDLNANVLHDLAWDAYTSQDVEETYLGKPLDTTAGKLGDVASNGHGTHVSGIAAARANNGVGLAGASYNASILPINAVNPANGSGSLKAVIRAYNYIFNLVDSGKANVRVVNLSMGAYYTSSGRTSLDIELEAIIEKARDKYGIATVCAAGNRAKTEKLYPSDYDACISVTALEPDGTNWISSDYNEYKDISAPGDSIWSAKAAYKEIVEEPEEEGDASGDSAEPVNPDASDESIAAPEQGANTDEEAEDAASSEAAGLAALSSSTDGVYDEYSCMSGTSMAAPIVSGTIALMFAVEPDATVDEVCEALYATATPIVDPEHDRSETSGSHGALDAKAAIDYLVEHHYKKFVDVKEANWFFEAVNFATKNGIMNGDNDGSGKFRPNDGLKREEAAAVLYNYFGSGAPVFENGEPVPETAHTDVVQGAWYANAVNWVVAMGYMNGHAGTTEFGVGDILSRQELACLMVNVTGTDLEAIDLDDTKFLALPDHEDTSNWAKPSVVWATSQGVINGKDIDGVRLLAPKEPVTRAEMAAVMMNTITSGLLSGEE